MEWAAMETKPVADSLICSIDLLPQLQVMAEESQDVFINSYRITITWVYNGVIFFFLLCKKKKQAQMIYNNTQDKCGHSSLPIQTQAG